MSCVEPSAASMESACGAVKRACPLNTVTFFVPRNHFSMPVREPSITSSLRAFTRAMSMVISPPIITPYCAAVRATCAARALATYVLVGVQPTFTQVPPNRCRSITAVRLPLCASRTASGEPPCPVPMTTASKCCAMLGSPCE